LELTKQGTTTQLGLHNPMVRRPFFISDLPRLANITLALLLQLNVRVESQRTASDASTKFLNTAVNATGQEQ
jgi:hypothetical protein